jgi:lysozyme
MSPTAVTLDATVHGAPAAWVSSAAYTVPAFIPLLFTSALDQPAAPSSPLPSPSPPTLAPTPFQRFNSRLTLEEGRRYRAYRDTFQFVTIGIGHNLGAMGEDSDKPLFERHAGADFFLAKTGRVTLLDPQVNTLLDADLSITLVYARKLVPSYDQLPPSAQEVVVDMAFNLGPAGLRKFRFFRASLEQRDWQQAAWDMTHKNRNKDSPPSDYAQQVPNRASRNAALLNGLAQNPGR